ncbi:aminotransferase class IV [Labrys okinawensis]|uniref:aminotransferase class IV n=1 Tax=Labrys okinawensis TaxID=346911 RepID=UPI0039BD67E2
MSFLIHRLHALPAREGAAISVLDRGFQLGDGVFDTMVSFGGHIFLRDRHIERLRRHAETIGIRADRVPFDDMIDEVLAEAGGEHAIIRTTLTRGQAPRGLWPGGAAEPSLLVTAQPWSPVLLGQPARLCEASIPRNQHSPLSRIKSLAYLDNILAAREAADAKVDDALIRNLDGSAVCSTIANIFAVVDGMLVTPPRKDGCLDGIMRALVLEEATAMGLHHAERSLTPTLLARADELFLTNSVRVIRPVTALGERSLPTSAVTAHVLTYLLARIERETSIRLDLTATPLP